MPAEGIYYRDLHATPENTQVPVGDDRSFALGHEQNVRLKNENNLRFGNEKNVRLANERSPALGDEVTESHALATADHANKGASQLDHNEEVKDLGWFDDKRDIPAPLVGGLDNETLWMLVRRFNKQVYQVKATIKPVPGNLDLNIADEDEFSPDKLRSTVERLYMTLIIDGIGFGKHIARLRSWRETRRTSCFCAAYFIAWTFDFVVPLLAATTIALIAYPPCRAILFPPVPLALVNMSTGGVQKPTAGVLGTHDSMTGAPENHKGEAVEQEASNFVNSIAHIALSSATGKHPGDSAEDKGDTIPDPASLALGAADAKTSADGGKSGAHQDKTKAPMETAMWNKMRPIMHGIADLADNFERFQNALSPTPPFSPDSARLRLAGVVVALLAGSLFITSYMVVKGTTFGIGFGFFGDPIIVPSVKWLTRTFPDWQKFLELRRSLLKGVPTNAQLTITLLRIGEANKAPLPPPPMSNYAPPSKHIDMTNQHISSAGGDLPLGASDSEILAASIHDPRSVAQEANGDDIHSSKKPLHGKKGAKVLGLLKSGIKGVVETAIGADKLKASVGSHHAKDRLGVIPEPDDPTNLSGPIDFKARYDGKKGHAYITTKATTPCISFTTDHSVEKLGTAERQDLHPVWSIPVADIKGIKKIGGYGWKARLVIGWALDREIADGMEITDRKGMVWKITAMPLRDELFNRLVAMGGQKWEAW